MLLKDKNILVTGGSRGIGKTIVQTLVKQGANVGFTYLSSPEKAQEIEKNLATNGQKVQSYKSDASDYDQSVQLVEDFEKDFGTLHVLVNNAGITKDNLILRMTPEDFNRVVTVNLNSVFNLTKASIRGFVRQKQGSIINMSSIVGMEGNAGQSNYAASKAGIIGFTKSIAKEFGSRNIRCNAIAPGFIGTEMTEQLSEEAINDWMKDIPLKRPGKTSDVAHAVTFLASDMSEYITGQVLNVCGGLGI